MASVDVVNVRKSYGATEVIHNVSANIADGEFVILVGPSGCGKSTLLRMIAGLESITAGDIRIGDRVVNHLAPKDRDIAMVFQNYALYPHKTVAENMGFALKLRHASKAEIETRVRRAAEILDVTPYLSRYPRQLSGGQRQRVAMGRAIVRDPKVFLFDEPLSNLDAKLRVQMRAEIKELHQRLKTTTVYVTHDQVEAMTMADRIVVLNGGKVEQVGSPLELYHNPANRFVAGFIGSPTMNMVDAVVAAHADGGVRVALPGGAALDIPAPTLNAAQGTTITLGLRPEALELAPDGPFKGTADIVEHLGSETLVYVKSVHQGTLIVKTSGLSGVKPGDRVAVMAKADRACLFDGEGRSLMRRPLQKKDGFFL
jgi:multiple sugar transport system ATP-binding protein